MIPSVQGHVSNMRLLPTPWPRISFWQIVTIHEPWITVHEVWLSSQHFSLQTESRKLSPMYICPYVINRIINPSVVTLKAPTISCFMFHASSLFSSTFIVIVQNTTTFEALLLINMMKDIEN